MKQFSFIIVLLVLVGCKSKSDEKIAIETEEEVQTEVKAPVSNGMNTVVFEENDEVEEEILLGHVNRNGLEMEPFGDFFASGYKNHELDMEAVAKITPLLIDVDIHVFMATWCEDSIWEVPALYKILDNSKIDFENLYVVAVDAMKKTPSGIEEIFKIEYVPTIIFIKDDIELGRIVESPVETLEKDILAILSGEDYKHSYVE